jgi:hypothetical protein
LIQLGDFGGVPIGNVAVEDPSVIKHCRKKKRQCSFTVNATKEEKAKEP